MMETKVPEKNLSAACSYKNLQIEAKLSRNCKIGCKNITHKIELTELDSKASAAASKLQPTSANQKAHNLQIKKKNLSL